MAKFLGYVLLIFGAIVLLNFVLSMAGSALTSYGPSLFPDVGGPTASSGLKAVDFSIFDKGGDGYEYITQGYGDTPYAYLYVGHWHDGIDIAADFGAPIYSPTDGIVIATGDQDNYCFHKGFGRYVALGDPKNKLVLWFAHLGQILVSPGDSIKKGTEVGAVGNTGFETGTHLHFSIFELDGFSMKNKNGCGPDPDGKDVNPLSYLGTVYQ